MPPAPGLCRAVAGQEATFLIKVLPSAALLSVKAHWGQTWLLPANLGPHLDYHLTGRQATVLGSSAIVPQCLTDALRRWYPTMPRFL